MPRKLPFDNADLCAAMQRSRLALRYPRQERVDMARLYAGKHYSEEGARVKQPVNLMALYLGIMQRSLVPKNPRVLLSTFQQAHKPVVHSMQQWANKEIVNIRLAETLRRIVFDALFRVGIAKVALTSPADAALVGWQRPAGTPFVERVDFDDFVFDIHCRDLREASFIGHRFRAPLEVIKKSVMYGRGRKDVEASDDPFYNQEGDERINVIGRTYLGGDQEEFEKMVDLWEVYLPRHKIIVTLFDGQLTGAAVKDIGLDPLRVQRWLGPECGPYHFLALGGVMPGNPLPKAPLDDLVDLHEIANTVFRKLMRQAERQKTTYPTRGMASEDGSRNVQTNDGEVWKCEDPQSIIELVQGGPDQKNFAFFTAIKDLFSWLAGNLDMMGGLSPQSKTLGQDELLAQNATSTVADKAEATTNFTGDVLKALCWYWHHDPQRIQRVTHNVPGLPDFQVQGQITPEQRLKVPWNDLDIKVDPYSMTHSTPASRLAALNQIMQSMVLPMMPLLQQQGVSLDINRLLQLVAALMDEPELQEVLTIQEPPQTDTPSPTSGAPSMPQQTQRKYIRQNMSAPTRQGSDLNMVSTLMSGKEVGGANGKPRNMVGGMQ